MSSRAEISPDREELLPTRRSLLDRLRDWKDQASSREFFDPYWKFIYSVAVKSGLSDQEAEDVVQKTILSVAKKMPDFVYDPAWKRRLKMDPLDAPAALAASIRCAQSPGMLGASKAIARQAGDHLFNRTAKLAALK